MHWLVWQVIGTFINTFIIINIVDIILIGNFQLKFSNKSKKTSFMITKENRIDAQEGNSCSGYSIAYILRHYDISAYGNEIYSKLPNKTKNGYVYPKEVKRMLEKYGFNVKYCVGNLHALRNEVSKGNPVIVFIKVRKDKNWLHFVPVVGYDENNVFIAESLAELVNCNENTHNRKICNEDFKILWNTSMLKMPLYTHTFFSINRNLERRTNNEKNRIRYCNITLRYRNLSFFIRNGIAYYRNRHCRIDFCTHWIYER